jgi:hypothetical protein
MNIKAPPPTPNENQLVQLYRPKDFNGIYVIGDFPYDSRANLPFANAHYGTLKGLARSNGFDFDQCVQTNLLPHHPPHAFIGIEQKTYIDASIADVKSCMETLVPKAFLFLGRSTLRWVKPSSAGVDEERGAPFLYQGVPAIATYHPREIYLEYHNYAVVQADFGKAARYVREGWTEPKLEIIYAPTFPECVSFLQSLLIKKPYLATDWESVDSIFGPYSLATCIGFGINGQKAFTIPFVKAENKHYFTLEEEMVIWRLVAKVLESCPQVGHNALQYDHWFAAYWQKILMHVVDDTMFAHWEVYTEMEKSLSFCSSLYLDTPYWKDELKLARTGKVPRDREFIYNGRDNCITLQVAAAIGKEFKELPSAVRAHYKFNVRCSRVFQYMSLRGCVINRDKLSDRLKELRLESEQLERRLEEQAKKKIKVTSPKQMKEWLYKDLRLPIRTKVVKLDDGSSEERETADFLALAYSAREYPDIPALMTAALLRKLLKRISSLNAIKTGPNGECYWNFNLVGTETGRASGYKPYNGMGVQPQNPDRRDRDLFEAGSGMVWGKCDLEGADAWTVAGQLCQLGDDTMLKDLQAGLKPAQILSLATIVGEQVISWGQGELRELLRQHKPFLKTDSGKQIYATAKAVSHGTNYMMQAPTMHMTIFKQSKAELYVSVKDCEKKRLLYLKRYKGLERLYAHIPTIINSHGHIDCPSGMRRVFFGRNDNHRTRVGLSLIPQNNTAYATNRALHNLYYQPYNRRDSSTALIIQPMNQVHDECDLAFYENEIEKVREIFTQATDFGSEVWGVKFKIPFDPNYGENWGNCETPIFGEE